MNNNYLYTILLIVAVAIAFWFGRFTASEKEIMVPGETKYLYDTMFVVETKPPIIVEKAVPKIIYRKDSSIKTFPFRAVLDTILVYDTIKVAYDFPENRMDIDIRLRPDSSKTVTNTIIKTQIVSEKRAWWIDALTHIGAFGIGFIIGK